MLRGNHREALFGSTADRLVLNDIVADVLEKMNTRIHGFCWMSNHLHMLVQVSERPLGDTMKRIAMRFSRFRHKALQTTGHLFERRYKSKLVDVDAYFLTVLRYIHMNPVKAGIAAHPSDYRWSGHQAYLGAECIPWLTTHFGLSLFSAKLEHARIAYEKFVLEPVEDEESLNDKSHPDDSRVIGTDQFIANIPAGWCRTDSPLSLEELAEVVCVEHNVGVKLLRSKSSAHALTPIRLHLLQRAVRERIATLAEVARFLSRDPSTLVKLSQRHWRNVQ
ncbi:MAG: transposase [Woeseia sp.]